jgi:carboxypeptidase family protein/TonB-dependent receptor-like protein
MRFSHAVVITALLSAPAGLVGQSLSGRILDAHTRSPLSGVELRLLQEDRVVGMTVSDTAGSYAIRAPGGGRYRLLGSRLGYSEARSDFVELATGQGVSADLLMSGTTVKVAPLIVETPRDYYLDSQGFYERQASRAGDFMTGEQIQRRNPATLSDLLRGLRGIKIQRVNFYNEVYFAGASCYPSIIVDGQTMRWGGKSIGVSQPLDDLVRIAHIDAIEAYRGGSGAPSQYVGPNAACGVILIWTRHR